MNVSLVILLALVAIFFVYFIIIFNNLVSLRNNIKRNWSNTDVLLKQRNSELNKLIETCKQYMTFEQETLTEIVQARSAIIVAQETQNMAALSNADLMMRTGIGKLFALSENYPDLKTNQTFQHLQIRISSLENEISDRRELYNDSVNLNNIRIEQFPDSIIAKMFKFSRSDLLKFSTSETEDIDVSNLFKK